MEDPSQAQRILARFGGARRLAQILNALGRRRNYSTIYKWTYPRSKGGTDGLIPTSAWPDIKLAARYEGIILSPEDVEPRSLTTIQKQSAMEYEGDIEPTPGELADML